MTKARLFLMVLSTLFISLAVLHGEEQNPRLSDLTPEQIRSTSPEKLMNMPLTKEVMNEMTEKQKQAFRETVAVQLMKAGRAQSNESSFFKYALPIAAVVGLFIRRWARERFFS